MVLLSGVVLLESKAASAVIEIKEWRRHYYRHTIELQTYAHKKIGARMFHNRAVERSRPSLLRIFVKTDIVLIQRHLSQAQVPSRLANWLYGPYFLIPRIYNFIWSNP